MALANYTEDRPRSGWFRPVQRLASAHAAFGTKAVAAVAQPCAQQAASLPSELAERASLAEARAAELAKELELALAKISVLERRVADEKTSGNAAIRQLEAVKEQNGAANRRVAALEAELAAERSDTDLQKNEVESLRTSLDLTISENSRMAARVDLAESLLAEARIQTESLRAEVVTVDVERIKTVDVAQRADEKYQTEARKLQDDLAAMTARARTAETLLMDARECLVIRIAENEKLACSLAQATTANRDADNRLEGLGDLLRAKELQIKEVEQSRQMLMTKLQKLLEDCQSGDRALARAEEKIKLLEQWSIRLEAEARRNIDQAKNVVAVATLQPRTEVCAPIEDSREATRRKWMELAQELARLDLKRQLSGNLQVISAPDGHNHLN